MRKKFIAVICTFALALSLPVFAWAAPSPGDSATGEQTTTTDDGITITVSLGENSTGSVESVKEADRQASNVPELATTDEVLASFEVIGDATNVDLTFYVGDEWVGYTVTVYIQHEDSAEVKSAVVAPNGTISVHVDKLSLFTLVVDTTTAPTEDEGTQTDTGATSPKTGVYTDTTTGIVAGLTIACAIAAAFVAVALRKRALQ